jgi:hypothetical protein
MNRVFSAWADIKRGICKKDAYHKRRNSIGQPIIWNSSITLPSRQMIGSQPKLAWRKLVVGPARSVGV